MRPLAAGAAAGLGAEERAAEVALWPGITGIAFGSDRRLRCRAAAGNHPRIGRASAADAERRRQASPPGALSRRWQRGQDALDDRRGRLLEDQAGRLTLGLASAYPL